MTVWGVSRRRAMRAVLPRGRTASVLSASGRVGRRSMRSPFSRARPAAAGSRRRRRRRQERSASSPAGEHGRAGQAARSPARRRSVARETWTGTLLQLIDRRGEFLPDPEERDYLGGDLDRRLLLRVPSDPRDRKSTRLNSSHLVISYAVFCL